jgi:hypothetical protein
MDVVQPPPSRLDDGNHALRVLSVGQLLQLRIGDLIQPNASL